MNVYDLLSVSVISVAAICIANMICDTVISVCAMRNERERERVEND